MDKLSKAVGFLFKRELLLTLVFILILGSLLFRVQKVSAAGSTLLWDITNNPSSGTDRANGVAIDGSGIYVAGYDYVPGNGQWRMEKRSLTDGSLIWEQTNNPSSGTDRVYGVAVDSSGVYVVGYDYVPGNYQWRMEKRSLTDGSLIWEQTNNPSSGTDRARGVAVDGSGVYVVGDDRSLGLGQWRMEKRSLTDGSLIWEQINDLSGSLDSAIGAAVDGSGVYVVGFDRITGGDQWRMEKRSLTDGSLIWEQTSNPSSSTDVAMGAAVDGSGVYVVGYDRITGNYQWRMEKRSLTDGSLIWEQNSNPSSSYDSAIGAAVDGSGIYVAGYDYAPGNSQWRIEKRSTSPDNNYIDIGLRIYDGAQTVSISCEPLGTLTSPLRMSKGGNTYGVALVDVTDPNASKIRINASSGIKALRKQ